VAEEVAANGSEFWVVTLANAPQVDPDPSKRKALESALSVDSLYYPDRRIHDFAEAHSLPVVTLAGELADYAAAHHVYLNGGYIPAMPFGEGHWNEVAHGLAASVVGRQLCSSSGRLRNSSLPPSQ
jgi:hypothetical protein